MNKWVPWVMIVIAAVLLVAVPQHLMRGVTTADPVSLNRQGLDAYHGSGGPRNFQKAMELFRQAAERDYTPAQVNLGLMYDHGDGVPRDYGKALHWYRRAAELGDRDGRRLLGYMHFYGLGTERDPRQAMTYFIASVDSAQPGIPVAVAQQPAPRLIELAAR